MKQLLLVLLLAATAPLVAQTLPAEVHFPAGDTVQWHMSVSMRTQGTDPKSGEEMDMIAGTGMQFRVYDPHVNGDVTMAQGRISNQHNFIRTLKHPSSDKPRDTSFSTAGEGIELFPLTLYFDPLGEVQEVALTDNEPITEETEEEYMKAQGSLVKFRDLFKMIFMGLHLDGSPTVGEEWELVEIDTTEERGLSIVVQTVSTWRYNRAMDTLGHRVAVLSYTADSVSMTDSNGEPLDWMKLSLPSHKSRGIYYVDLTTGLPVYAANHAVMELTFDFGNLVNEEKESSGKSKKKRKKNTEKAPPAITMKMTMETEAVMAE